MTHDNMQARTESVEVDGHVVTHGCEYHSESKRWKPVVSVKSTWSGPASTVLDVKPEDYQDTPQDAMDFAANLASGWIAENAPSWNKPTT